MTTPTDLVRLMTWLSPGFPVGAFGYSHGLEQAVRAGVVADAAGLEAWIAGLVEHGSAWTDAVLFKAAWFAADDASALREVAELAEALAPSLERHRETMGQGEAFGAAARAWVSPLIEAPLPYPVAVGAAAGRLGLGLDAALAAWLHGFCANQVSVALRTIPLGQTDGVAVLAALEPVIVATAARAAGSDLEALGGGGICADIAAMRHETLDGRLFVS